MKQHWSFENTIIGVGTSVVNGNIEGWGEGGLEGDLFGLSLETCVKKVDTPVCRCLMIQAHWTVGLCSD